MARDPVVTLLGLNRMTLQLNETQAIIDQARAIAPTDQYLQLELDRTQSDIDAKRAMIELAMADIRNRN